MLDHKRETRLAWRITAACTALGTLLDSKKLGMAPVSMFRDKSNVKVLLRDVPEAISLNSYCRKVGSLALKKAMRPKAFGIDPENWLCEALKLMTLGKNSDVSLFGVGRSPLQDHIDIDEQEDYMHSLYYTGNQVFAANTAPDCSNCVVTWRPSLTS